MTTRTLSLFVALLFIGAGLFTTNAQAQTDASHDVTVEIDEFTFIGPPGDEVGLGDLGDLKVTFDGGSSSPASIDNAPSGVTLDNNTRNISGGIMSATAEGFQLRYGTNSTDDEKITVTSDGSWDATNGSIDVTSTATSITNTASASGGSAGSTAGTVTLDGTGNQDFVTGINQGGGTVDFKYGFTVGLYTEAQSVTQTVTYTLTAN